jgi:hypothetical protein
MGSEMSDSWRRKSDGASLRQPWRKVLISGADFDYGKSRFSYSFHVLGIESAKGPG